ncbi:MAG: tryptophanyl-tRNA synthetase [Parcubacteria group bacterium Gr01-1014_2]|nr:MAG: tryptophanyl-tRNA synthetase [Parcubacteria group bacterium Gr01-1014_2]
MKKVSLTGDRPTGPLHIGHYFGSLVSRKELENEYESFVMIADVQALTDHFKEPEKVRDNVMEVALDYLAFGLDPQKTTFFIQSKIPQIAELTVFFSNLVTINTLKRNPTVKDEITEKKDLFGAKGEKLTYGFLGYPVSQAADITIVRADVVPVGQDQLPMIELTREIAEKFHRIYKTQIFPLPQAKLSQAPRIMGLDGNAKMSKSLNNAIFLKDSPEEIKEKIKTAKTDSFSTASYDPKKRPEISNLLLIYGLIHSITPQEAAKEMGSVNYTSFKSKLAEDLIKFLEPVREKRKGLEKKSAEVMNILTEGTQKTLARAEETINLVKKAMKIDY